MNEWLDSEVEIDAATAAVIARDMRVVALADGIVHEREMNLIAAFEAEIPVETPAVGDIVGEGLRLAYLRSLIMVALADGVITEAELTAIQDLAEGHGIPGAMITSEVLGVKRTFLSVFAGVNIFRDSVVRVARDLGLSESELDALRQEA